MAGVAVIYAVRRLTSRTALECYALFVSAFSVTMLVSLSHVTANLILVSHRGLISLVLYFFSAVLGTTLVVQIALVIGTLATLSILKNTLGRTIAPTVFA